MSNTVEIYRTCHNPRCSEPVESVFREAYCSWECARMARNGGELD